jgi:hypothetical protein
MTFFVEVLRQFTCAFFDFPLSFTPFLLLHQTHLFSALIQTVFRCGSLFCNLCLVSMWCDDVKKVELSERTHANGAQQTFQCIETRETEGEKWEEINREHDYEKRKRPNVNCLIMHSCCLESAVLEYRLDSIIIMMMMKTLDTFWLKFQFREKKTSLRSIDIYINLWHTICMEKSNKHFHSQSFLSLYVYIVCVCAYFLSSFRHSQVHNI